jgi:hypothetical protein
MKPLKVEAERFERILASRPYKSLVSLPTGISLLGIKLHLHTFIWILFAEYHQMTLLSCRERGRLGGVVQC